MARAKTQKNVKAASKTPVPAVADKVEPAVIAAFKGFDLSFQCRGFQYEVGKTYEHGGAVTVCDSGFHACQSPLDIFDYYAPGLSRYASVTQSGEHAFNNDDSKVVSAKIKIEAELKLPDFISAAVKWIVYHTTPATSNHSTGDQSAAMAAGRDGRAIGEKGCALFLVHRDDEYNMLIRFRHTARTPRNDSAATVSTPARTLTDRRGISLMNALQAIRPASRKAVAKIGRANGAGSRPGIGGVLAVCLNRISTEYNITHAWAGIVGQSGIEPLVWYTLNENGQPVKCEATP